MIVLIRSLWCVRHNCMTNHLVHTWMLINPINIIFIIIRRRRRYILSKSILTYPLVRQVCNNYVILSKISSIQTYIIKWSLLPMCLKWTLYDMNKCQLIQHTPQLINIQCSLIICPCHSLWKSPIATSSLVFCFLINNSKILINSTLLQ